ncbi:uncharacterized protein [Primulina huaijiensis]|uniref:uncharacterized protein n=1 Tax=Primulina huaijiensis TaxID=1492673 RepID=UPI003CC6F5A7
MWESCKWSKTNKEKLAYSTMMSMSFWNSVTLCLKIFAPLVRVIRLVDGDRKPYMGFLYGEPLRAKEDIKVALNYVESNYQPIRVIIESKMKDRLDTSLHTTTFLLNPYFYYKYSSIALYGEVTIHTKKRNRLDVNRLNNIVFVQFNARLFNKQKREKERNVDVFLEKDASNEQGWIVDGGKENEVEPGSGLTWQLVDEATGADGNLQPRRSSGVRELHEDDFESEEEDDDHNDDIDFVSDEEQVVENIGEEEVE